ncbi:MAG: PAS domain S-box protein [Promethearchaeota archaeon]|nr:MAG: PAS domain S-box protein [Candidatus Lokiarchaeota archaeon]
MTSISNKLYDVRYVLYDSLDDPIYIISESHICEFINTRIHEKQLGYNSIDKKFHDLVHIQDLKKLNKFFSKLEETGQANEQLRIKEKGDYGYYEITGKKFYDEASNLKFFLHLKDINNYKDIENKLLNHVKGLQDLAEKLPEIRFWNLMQTETSKKALQRTRDMLEKVIDTIPQLLYWKDKDLNYIGCNLNYALINDLEKPRDIIGKKDEDLPWMHQYKSIIQQEERKVMKSNEATHVIESWNFTKNGKKYFEVNRIPLHNLEGKVIGVLSSYNDITDRTQAEEKLKKSEKKYKEIIESIQEGYFEVDLEGNFTFFNDTFRNMSGYSKEELLEKNYRELTDQENANEILNSYNAVFKTGQKKKNLQFKYYNKQKEEVIVEHSVDLIYDSDGNKIGFFGLGRDITEKYNLEQELKQSEAMYRLITENAYDLISIINQKLRFEYVNEEPFLSILGYSKEEILGKSVLNLILPEERERSLKILSEGLKKGEGILETKIQHKNGDLLWVEVKGKTFRDKDGKIKGILTGRDITERKLAEEKLKILNQEQELIIQEKTKELRDSEEKFRHLYENSPYGIILLNPKGEIIDCNIAISKIFGYELDDLVGNNYLDLLTVYPEKTKPLLRKMGHLLSKNDHDEPIFKPQAIKIYKKDGSECWVDSEISLIRLGDEVILQLIIQDITEKKKSEEMLMQSEQLLRSQYDELKELDRLKTDFISIAAHELKTPLISVGGYVDLILLREKDLKKEIREDLNRVLNNVHRLEEYINRLLDVLKIDARKMELVMKPVNIYRVVENSIQELDFQIKQKNLDVNVNVNKDIMINGDSFRIQQVFSNLLSNAIKFTQKQGKIDISAKLSEAYYTIVIEDNGKGLTTEQISQLFGKFVTLEKTSENFSTLEKGSGLGLYIAKGIIEAHEGKIWVTSEGLNKGSKFFFTLPVVDET